MAYTETLTLVNTNLF